MVLGVGVDLIGIDEMALYIEIDDAFERQTFTKREQQYADSKNDKIGYYAGLFALKRAVFKTLKPWTNKKLFDFRCVEAVHPVTNVPSVSLNGELLSVMDEAGIGSFMVSVSQEEHYAIAYVVAQSEEVLVR